MKDLPNNALRSVLLVLILLLTEPSHINNNNHAKQGSRSCCLHTRTHTGHDHNTGAKGERETEPHRIASAACNSALTLCAVLGVSIGIVAVVIFVVVHVRYRVAVAAAAAVGLRAAFTATIITSALVASGIA